MKFYVVALILFFIGLSVVSIRVQKVYAAYTSDVIINSDGSISPDTAPIQRNGNIYTLTSNVSTSGNWLFINRSNIIFDGAGHKVESIFDYNAIALSSKNNVTIKDVEIRKFNYAFSLQSCSNIIIVKNTLLDNNIGVGSTSCFNLNIAYNTIRTKTDRNYGIDLQYCSDCVLARNNISDGVAGIALERSGNNFVVGNSISGCGFVAGTGWGILIGDAGNNRILYNQFYYNLMHVRTLSQNIWSDGAIGNYWDDYHTKHPSATITNGIWNTAYTIDANNVDNQPVASLDRLQFPPLIIVPEFPSLTIIPLFIILTLLIIMLRTRCHLPSIAQISSLN